MKSQPIKIVAILIALVFCHSCLTVFVQRRELLVGQLGYPFSSITEALHDAKPGDIIRVMDGSVYSEYLKIAVTNLTLDFNGSTLKGHKIEIHNANRVTIKNGTVTDVPGGYAMELVNSDNCVIEKMTFKMNEGEGVSMIESSYNTIESCVFEDNKGGGSTWEYSSFNRFKNNTIKHCYIGIGAYYSCNWNEISGNTIIDSKFEHGINIGHNSNGNIIINNKVERNEWEGITLHDHVSSNVVAENMCYGNHKGGICIHTQTKDNIIRDNIVRDNWERGIKIDEGISKDVFKNNIVENNKIGDHRYPGVQDDAGLGRDATNEGDGDYIPWGVHMGYLSDVDIRDCYKIPASAGKEVRIKLISSSGTDFDLNLKGPGVRVKSNKFQSLPDEILVTPKENGFLTVRVGHWEGEGEYSLVVGPIN